MNGALGILEHTVLTAAHLAAARARGHNAADMLETVKRSLQECITLADHLAADMEPGDPNRRIVDELIRILR